jgi:hypothetical protein
VKFIGGESEFKVHSIDKISVSYLVGITVRNRIYAHRLDGIDPNTWLSPVKAPVASFLDKRISKARE